MPTNPYSDAVRQLPEEQNPYAATVLDMKRAKRSQLRSAVAEAVRTNPDQYARARQLSEQTGIPAPVVERNFDDVERRVKVNEYDKLLQDSPVLAELMRSPDFAKLVHDDLDNAGFVERAAGAVGSAFFDFNAAFWGALQASSELVEGGFGLLPRGLLPANPATPMSEYFAAQRRGQSAIAERVRGDLSDAGAIERGVYSGLQSTVQFIPAAVGTFITKNPNTALAIMGGQVFGPEYGRARDEGLPPGEAFIFAGGQAAIEIVTERIAVSRLLGEVSRRAGLLETLTRQLAAEIPGEQVATLLQDLNQWAVLNPEKPFADYLAERPSAAAETFFATLVATGAQTGGVKAIDEVARRLSGEQMRADQSQAALEKLAELARLAGESKLRERAPETFAQFVEQASADGEVQDVYVEARQLGEVLNQSGIDPADVSPAVAEQFEEAQAVGGDVRIPVAEFAARIAGQDYADALLPHLRADPEAMSAAEVEEFNQGAQEQFKAEAEKALAQAEDRDAFEASAEVVAENIRGQLATANRFTADVNNAYAALMRDFYTVAAQRLGITPEEMFTRYPLRIVSEGVEGSLDQLAPEQFSSRELPSGIITVDGRDESGFVAHIDLKPRGSTELQILLSEVEEDRQGEGIGQQLIQRAWQEANLRGLRLVSDTQVSVDQLRAYEALKRKGWAIEYTYPDETAEVLQRGEGDAEAGHRPVVSRIEPPATLNQRAFHGSPHQFTKFSLANIGTGEGAQAFGWGLYFAESEGVARSYHTDLTRDRNVTIDEFDHDKGYGVRDENGELHWFHNEQDAKDFKREREGALYEVEISDEAVERMLDWDAPLIDQPEVTKAVNDAIGLNEETIDYWKDQLVEDLAENGPGGYSDDRLMRVIDEVAQYGEYGPEFGSSAYDELREAAPERADEFIDVVERQGAGGIDPQNDTGRQVYQMLASALGSEQKASERLLAAGIPGIKYLDAASRDEKEGTRNLVLFDDSLVTIKSINGQPVDEQTLDQRPSGPGRDLLGEPGVTGLTELVQGATSAPRGQIRFDDSGATIALLKNADLSTFLHESGHFFLEVYADLAVQDSAPEAVSGDFNALLKWFGVPDAATWQGMTLEQRRPHHEKFARGFEAYLFEGKAPTTELNSIFARFRAWLINVYKSLTALDVELTDEVRDVMGRMLASERAIDETEQARSFAPMFESAEDAGMTEQEFAAYVESNVAAREDATEQLQKRSLRDMRWLSNAKSRVLKKLQKDAKAKRNSIRKEVAAEVAQEQVYRARRFIRTGEVGRDGEVHKIKDHKLSLEALKEMYPDSDVDWQQLTGGGKYRPVSAKGGLHPDFVAEMLGFTSGDHLVRALFEAPPIDDAIEVLTDTRMLETYGDITDLVALERAADEAVHNEARARFVATEIRALNRLLNVTQRTARGGSVNVTLKAAKEFAEATIARLRIRDVRPAKFRAAEARAAKAADAELRAGNTLAAATEKRNQLVNTQATRAAYDAQAEIEKGLRYLNKFSRDGVRKNIDLDYVDQIDQLLERFDLRRRQPSDREMAKRASLVEWVESQRELGFEPTIDPALLAEARRQPYREMTVEQFRGLVDAVRNIEHLGRLKNKLLTSQRERRFDEAVDEAVRTIEDNARKTIPDELEHEAFAQRVKSGVSEFFAMHRKFASIVRQMDGFKDGGALWELFVRPLNAAADKEASMREAATIKLTELFQPILKGASLRQKLYIPAIGKSLSREGRLSIALNWGNETNRLRVLEGDKWTPEQAQAILDTLTKEEWDFVQSVWDYIDSYWPQIAEKEQRVTGLRPAKVEAAPVQTPFGEYRGGYYPISYDPLRSSKAESDTMAETLRESMRGLYTRATTRRGHTKARVESVKRPMRKDLGVIFQHITQVTHDLAFHEYLIDASRLLRASGVDSAIREHYGPEILRQMRNALDDVARGDIPAQNAFERAIHHIRVGATIAGLGWNLSTAMLQPIGLTQSMVRIGPKHVGRGLARWLGSARRMENSVAWIHEKSDFMRLRAKTMQREINEIQNTIRGREKLTPVKSSFFYMIQKLQMVADVPTWLGAYEKAMAEETDEARAIALADQAVLDAQGGGQIKDLAAIQRGNPLMKLWTNFYSFFNTTYNLSAESVRRTDFRKPRDIGRLAVDYLLLYTIPATLAFFLRQALGGGDDDEELAVALAKENLGFMLSTVVGLREIGGAVQGYSYRGPAGSRAFQEVSRLIEQAEQGEVDAALLKALNAAGGVLFHYPAGQVERTVEGAVAVAEGDTANPLALVAGPPEN